MADTPVNSPKRIPIVDPYGNLGMIDESEAPHAIRAAGFRMPSSDELKDFQDQETYGKGALSAAEAFGAGAARSATFGGSDLALTKSGLASPETLAALKKYRPGYSGAGEVAGIAAGLLAPEAEVAGGAVEGAGAAARAAEALGTPVRAVAKAGQAVGDAARPAIEKSASLAVNPETSPITHKILSQAGSTALGSAVEGAAYGLGQSVTESALGDPDMNAEKVMSNVGYSALLAGGLGAAIGAGSGAFRGISDKLAGKSAAAASASPGQALKEAGFSAPLTESEEISRYAAPGTAAESPSLRDALHMEGADSETKGTLLDGLQKTKANKGEIIDSSQYLSSNGFGDAPIMEGMVSGSKHVQQLDDMVRTSPDPAGVQRAQMYEKGYQTGSNAVAKTLGDEEQDLTLAQLGNKFKDDISSHIETQYAPVKAIYDELGEYGKAIPISDKSTGALSRTIGKIIDDEGLIRGTPEYEFVRNFADGIDQVENLEKLKQYRTALARATGPETRYVSGLIKEKLDALEERAIKAEAGRMKNGPDRERVMSLIGKMDDAKSGYKALRDKMEDLGGKVFGKRKIYGPQDFLDKIDEVTPEAFAKKIFARNDSEFMGWFAKEFPEQMQLMRQYQRAQIKEASTLHGVFSPQRALKQIDKLQPEIKSLLFSPEELKTIEKARTYLDSFPKNFNPSGTSSMEAYRRFTSPVSAMIGWGKSLAAEGFMRRVVDTGAEASQARVGALAKIERMGIKTAKQVQSGAAAIVKAGDKKAPAITGYAASKLTPEEKKERHQKVVSLLRDYAANPETAIDHMEEATQHLYAVAPNLTGSLHQVAARATSFLASKLPPAPEQKLFSQKTDPGQSEISGFARYLDAVENPISVLHQVRDGNVTPESIETIQAVYPKLYQEMQSTLIESISKHVGKDGPATIPYRTRLSLGLFLGQDLDGSLSQSAIAANQAAIAMAPKADSQAPQGPGGARPSKAGMGKITKSNQMMTAMQSVAQRGEA